VINRLERSLGDRSSLLIKQYLSTSACYM
jgi:hypothetical protein